MQRMRFGFAILLILLAVAGLGQEKSRAIKPWDRLKIVCEQEPSISKEYVVTKDGAVVLAFLGAMTVAGWTTEETASKIRDRLLNERILTEATVSVTFVATANRPVKYRGAVRFPGEAPWNPSLTLQEILEIAKPIDIANLAAIEITPAAGEPFTVDAELTNGKPLVLKAGDSIYVPVKAKSEEVYVLGGVLRPGVVAWTKIITVKAALLAAGGLNGQGDAADITLKRGSADPRKVLLSSDEMLHPGDTLLIALLPERRWIMVDGAVRKPGPVDYRDGITLSAAIHEVGGILPLIPLERAELKRTVNGKDQITKFNVDQILRGLGGDPKLQPGDRITIVPKKRRK